MIDDVSAAIFSAVLDFIYEGHCEIDEGQLPALLAASARLQVLVLQQQAVEVAKARLQSAENQISFWAIGEALTLPDLAAAAATAAAGSFQAIATGDALAGASHSQLLTLLQDDELEVEREELVFEAVRRWHDATQPGEAELVTLLRRVRFGLMPARYLNETVRAWPPMSAVWAQQLLLDALVSLSPGGTQPQRRRTIKAREEERRLEMAEEREAVSTADSTLLQDGQVWHIIEAGWMKHWREYVWDETRQDPPGPMDNTPLMDGDAIRPNLMRSRDYRGVNPNAWEIFLRKYGLRGPCIRRLVLDIYSAPVTPEDDVQLPID